MGGEYLPPLRKGEVEIARISLASVTADQICVRAQRARERIRYRVVDEYPETSTYVCHPASSVSPLSLGELIALMERASEGGSIIVPILAINSRYSTQAELAAFITVTSDFYTDLGGYYRALTDAWLEKRAREESNGSVAGGSAVALLDGGLGSPVARRFAASGASAIWIPFGIANDDLEDAMEHLGVALDSRYRKILDSGGTTGGLAVEIRLPA